MSSIAAPSTAIASTLARSRLYCEQLTRSAARNFYYGLKLLPRSKRQAMFALYAYMRHVDDIADDEDGRSHEQRLAELEAWRTQTHAAFNGGNGNGAEESHPLWPAFCEMIRAYRLPAYIFDDVIAGQEQDLRPIDFQTFEDLRQYCYRVAGTVGLASIHIWGFEGGQATEKLAVERGLAFQLTNILRDLREDSSRGRLYLPKQELPDGRLPKEPKAFLDLMQFQIQRAQSFYDSSAELESRIDRDSRASLVAMTRIYRGILNKIAADPSRVLRERISLSVFSKLHIAWHAVRGT